MADESEVIYDVVLKGKQPLLMHADYPEKSDELARYRKSLSRAEGVSGDDRSPAWSWITYLYEDPISGKVLLPSDNVMTCLREGGAKVKSTGRSTYKAATQSNIQVMDAGFDFYTGAGQELSYTAIRDDLMDEHDFEKHKKYCEDLGFMLHVKRAKVGSSKHVRVRPMFVNWTAVGRVMVLDPQDCGITDQVLENILSKAGMFSGLGDWRPSSPSKPGTFGTFYAEVTRA